MFREYYYSVVWRDHFTSCRISYFYYGYWASEMDAMFIPILHINYIFDNMIKKVINKLKSPPVLRAIKWVTGGIRMFQF